MDRGRNWFINSILEKLTFFQSIIEATLIKIHEIVLKENLTFKIIGLLLTSKLELDFSVISFVKMSAIGVLSYGVL